MNGSSILKLLITVYTICDTELPRFGSLDVAVLWQYLCHDQMVSIDWSLNPVALRKKALF